MLRWSTGTAADRVYFASRGGDGEIVSFPVTGEKEREREREKEREGERERDVGMSSGQRGLKMQVVAVRADGFVFY